MADDKGFDLNLSRASVASLFSLLCLHVSRDLLGKSYFALGAAEKQLVDQAALGLIAGNFQALSPEALSQAAKPVGFHVNQEVKK